jgi:hypothetical protein
MKYTNRFFLLSSLLFFSLHAEAIQFVGQINTPYVLNLVLDTKNVKQSYLIAATKLLGSKSAPTKVQKKSK